ncbi:helix-turn-helix transcriptional regulator [Acetobacteroides hydrogenigenes]|uniref:Putative DNA-binding transcriptional regulator YafY n=1 Tax=Acetobacteroides hydrogenigenes TaxID=979970 RepID=A0A4R2E1H1_9BACT|nr:WYL domain-containing protein [Acetobacteroides hydrogenigenes]TCN61628.1 putative DNA-binding transcriptional regulator YafY [Acetobacteroides hydrogenigenes]
MAREDSIGRIYLIVKRLRSNYASFEEIRDYLGSVACYESSDYHISLRTFQRDCKLISKVYKIEIEYDPHVKGYRIISDNDSVLNQRMLEAYDIFNALNLAEQLSNHIHFEDRRPQGTENLYGILHAITNAKLIKFGYQKFWDDSPTNRCVEPYALKEFKNRWYILAKDRGDNRIKSFALDRLTDFEVANEEFSYPSNFNINQHYQSCFGIISPDGHQPEEVILSFDAHQGKYIKTLPLHHSQEVLVDNEEELVIKLQIYITFDFKMEILSYGDNVRVVKPQSFIDDIKQTYRNALKQYKTES